MDPQSSINRRFQTGLISTNPVSDGPVLLKVIFDTLYYFIYLSILFMIVKFDDVDLINNFFLLKVINTFNALIYYIIQNFYRNNCTLL